MNNTQEPIHSTLCKKDKGYDGNPNSYDEEKK
jgi:hypothetical protein